MHLTIIYVTG